jgi:aryl-alcohol dehydrogenase-like predicted oxidoreductase
MSPVLAIEAETDFAIPTRPFGHTGKRVSVLGFGTAPIGLSGYQDPDFNQSHSEKDSLRTLDAAIDHGIRFFDTAPAYANKTPTDGWSTDRASERMLGVALGRHRALRDQMFIATKNMYDRMDADSIRKSLEYSLRLLGTDYVDLFQIHGIISKPFRSDNWRQFVTDEVLQTFLDLKAEGKTRYIGISGYREEALSVAIESGYFQAVMPQFNYFHRGAELELVKLAQQHGVAVIPMRPLTGGLLQAMIKEMFPGQAPAIDTFKVVMKYLLQFDSVATIPVGMRTVHEVEQNVRLIEALQSEIDLTLDKVYQ